MRAPAHVLLFLIAFVATTSLVRAFVPWPEEFGMRSKLDWFEEHVDEFDVLFVGSSRVFRGVLPSEFDAVLERRGIEVRSFNLGVAGMQDFETDRVLRWVLEREPARLEWVIVEAGAWDPRPAKYANLLTRRTVAWHDFPGTRNALEASLVLDLTLKERIAEALRHVRLCATWYANLGQGQEIARVLRGAPSVFPAEEIERDAGWQELRPEDSRTPEGDEEVELVRGQSKSHGRTTGPGAMRYFPVGAVRRQVERVEEDRIGIVHMSLPGSKGSDYARALVERDVVRHHEAYDLPARYPRLYAPELRADKNHMNAAGARELTRLMARDFAAIVEGGE